MDSIRKSLGNKETANIWGEKMKSINIRKKYIRIPIFSYIYTYSYIQHKKKWMYMISKRQ